MTTNNGHDMGAAGAETPAADPLAIPPFLRRHKVETIPMTAEISQAIAEADAPRMTHTAIQNENWKAATDTIPPAAEPEPLTLEQLTEAIKILRAKRNRKVAEWDEQIRILKRQAEKLVKAL